MRQPQDKGDNEEFLKTPAWIIRAGEAVRILIAHLLRLSTPPAIVGCGTGIGYRVFIRALKWPPAESVNLRS
ncbi:hypothetical protein CMI37_36745 [Candidatus Pacearchaeota archaeon]|nr:hypothetical protein [Candidatus Pacearchaeota archaeon]